MGAAGLSHPQTVSADSGGFQVFLPLLTNGGTNNSNSEQEVGFPTLTQFADTVKNGANQIAGLYVEKLLAKPVVQQPQGNYEYISNDPDTITQFMLTTPEVVGLLAHNHLAGKFFFEIQPGARLFLVNGVGEVTEFEVVEVHSYQVLKSVGGSKYQDLSTAEIIDTGQLFAKFYMGDAHLTLQTCISKDGDPSWGRLFIYAVPVN
ncbi:hypothetical protein [Bellilinea caldifistulae]|nr:hypothetical protein [Bellilinea caldifistulae]